MLPERKFRSNRLPINPMNGPPVYQLKELGLQAQMMARNSNNERLAMLLQCVAVGSMIIMAGAAAKHLYKDVVGSPDHDSRHGRSK